MFVLYARVFESKRTEMKLEEAQRCCDHGIVLLYRRVDTNLGPKMLFICTVRFGRSPQ